LNDLAPLQPARRSSLAGWVVLLLVLLMGALPVYFVSAVMRPGPLTANKAVVIPRGASGAGIADLLEQNGVIGNRLAFRIASRLMAKGRLQAGEYQFAAHQSIAAAIRELRDGRSVVRMFTAAEGLTSAEIVDRIDKNPVLTGAVAPLPPEGSLLPETYRYSYGDTRASIVAHMQKDMGETLEKMWVARAPGLPIATPAEAVILASIIEKETGKKDERAHVAEVFYNRLRRGMRLQSDPTVIYALMQGRAPLGRPLTRDDLAVASPYNTYINDGLPPGPICNPGRASLLAALHPDVGNDLYFVADGAGGHLFAPDLRDHDRNVAKWDKIRAEENIALPPQKPPPPIVKPAVKPASR